MVDIIKANQFSLIFNAVVNTLLPLHDWVIPNTKLTIVLICLNTVSGYDCACCIQVCFAVILVYFRFNGIAYHTNNEVMSVLNSGVSLSRIVRPIIILAVLLSGFYFLFNEYVAIPSSNEKALQKENITKDADSSNNQDIALSDMQSGYMVYAAIYSDSDQTLFDVSLVESDAHGKLIRRTDAYKAKFNPETGRWVFFDAYVYTPAPDGVTVEHIGDYENPVLLLEPQLFRNVSNEISTMSLDLAKAYLNRMKVLNPEQYASLGTEYYKRIFSCLTPLIMIAIACSLNYRFKRNVLFFSLVCSICIAVVYFVVQMMTVMLSDQGVIAPQLGTLIPFIVIIALTTFMGALLRRQ